MRLRLAALGAAATVVLAGAAGASPDASALSGRWFGSYSLGGSSTFLTLDLRRRSAEYPATGASPSLGRFRRTRTRLQFTLGGRLRFSGRLRGGRLVGTVRRGARRGRFELLRHPAVPPAVLRRYTGLYTVGGRTLTVFESSPRHGRDFAGEGARGLRLVDLGSGAVRGLYALSGTRFAAGRAFGVGHPVTETFSFPGLAASRVPLRRERVAFASSGAMLAGYLHLPPEPGPYPTVVMLHGSGAASRSHDYYQAHVYFFLSKGFAVLAYDKRGATDETTDEALGALADDALAGVAYLKRRSDVDARRIGLWGLSQGGWVGAIAAGRSADVAFSVLVSGGAATQAEEAVFSELTANETRQPSPAAVEREVGRAGIGTFDPTPYLRAMRAPSLWLLGASDLSNPPLQSARRLEAVRSQTGNPFIVQLFPRGDHQLYDTRRGLAAERPFARGYLSELFPTMAAWLAARGLLAP